jgi:hypothetical protein
MHLMSQLQGANRHPGFLQKTCTKLVSHTVSRLNLQAHLHRCATSHLHAQTPLCLTGITSLSINTYFLNLFATIAGETIDTVAFLICCIEKSSIYTRFTIGLI